MARGWRRWSTGSGVISSQVRLALEQSLIRSLSSTLMETDPAPGAIFRQGAASPGYVSARYHHVQKIAGSVACHSTPAFHDSPASDGRRAPEESCRVSMYVLCRLLLPIQALTAGRRGLTNPDFLGLTPGRPLQGETNQVCAGFGKGLDVAAEGDVWVHGNCRGGSPYIICRQQVLPQSLAALSNDVACHPCYLVQHCV
jgi:hypothetical protein